MKSIYIFLKLDYLNSILGAGSNFSL